MTQKQPDTIITAGSVHHEPRRKAHTEHELDTSQPVYRKVAEQQRLGNHVERICAGIVAHMGDIENYKPTISTDPRIHGCFHTLHIPFPGMTEQEYDEAQMHMVQAINTVSQEHRGHKGIDLAMRMEPSDAHDACIFKIYEPASREAAFAAIGQILPDLPSVLRSQIFDTSRLLQ